MRQVSGQGDLWDVVMVGGRKVDMEPLKDGGGGASGMVPDEMVVRAVEVKNWGAARGFWTQKS